ncbi:MULTISPECIES: alcohol dehydrogenase catalytic domain-containing protein [unclassified Actinopolyspora]|uniref:alcohol dehydrogenase catalytic domain-containing protein n=1 Tax=unclassified Actinopolyspora TaxID=2639451 RepID=UPI0013F615A8|nr:MULTISPECIES: alcohol dehydrogenase catalytic domain-containing protein [unclassified Actinopolyspora]NHD17598.1 alcohol dehydrogenase catalytic domain-containing protein [Actinopolyspora sp. BKK2]NHE76669.1 alcohol dehydrogenase catalytic domain-containing protein [Actinopolyspora sp. BKK1]
MSATMSAAVLHGAADVRVERRAVPRAAAGQALLAVGHVGLCGSDVHYYRDGRNGNNELRAPAVLGHEIGGRVVEVGPEVPDELVGATAVVEPAVPCRHCSSCTAGRYNLCANGHCLGSPPNDGGLAEYVAVDAAQLHRAPAGLPAAAVPSLEPLAVAVHALRRTGFAPGQSVLVTGAGPVGLLVGQVALAWGARRVTLTDVDESRLEIARTVGIERAFLPDELDGLRVERALECSGAVSALDTGVAATVPGGRVGLVGTVPDEAVRARLAPVQRYEIDLVGAFRYAGGFPEAIRLVEDGLVDLVSLGTASYPLERAAEALERASSGTGVKTTVECTTGR